MVNIISCVDDFINKLTNLIFSFHIPEVRIVTVEPLRAGKTCELLLKFSNPTQHQTVITFLPVTLETEETKTLEQVTEDSAVADEYLLEKVNKF